MSTKELVYDPVFDAQKHYRIILDSIARPGKISILDGVELQPPAGLNKASALTGFALLNQDVSFFVETNIEEQTHYLKINTASNTASEDSADFLFLSGQGAVRNVEMAKPGTLRYPDTSATLILNVEQISGEVESGCTEIQLKGPGVDGIATVYVRGLSPEIMDAIREKNLEYPLGIDSIITDEQNNIFCIPRTTAFRLV